MRPDAGEDLLVRGEAIGLVLRIDALAVKRHVEHATVSALEASGDSELFLDGGLQTGGLWVVVSFGAVGDLDVHAYTPFPAPRASLDDSRDGGIARASESPRAVGARGDSGARDWSSHSGNGVMVRRERNGASRPERTGSVASAVRGAVWQGEGIGSVAEKGILLESLTDCSKTRWGSGA